MTKTIIYEHPLNERIRTFLRLEYLFQQVRHFMPAASIWDSRQAIDGLLNIITTLERSDLKTEIIKELERHHQSLGRLIDTPGLDKEQLNNILHWLQRLLDAMHQKKGALGQELRDNPFLNAIRQRTSIPGGGCSFDLPIYHQWLHFSSERRKTDLETWLNPLDPVRQSIELILKLIRNSAEPEKQLAESGTYQQALNTTDPYQLIRIQVSAELPYAVEISGGKHRFTVRFLETRLEQRPMKTEEDVEFKLTCCLL